MEKLLNTPLYLRYPLSTTKTCLSATKPMILMGKYLRVCTITPPYPTKKYLNFTKKIKIRYYNLFCYTILMYKSIKKNLMIFMVICIIVSIFIYFLTQKYLIKPRKDISVTNLIPYIHDAKKELRVAKQSLPKSAQGLEYNINFWVFINDYNHRLNEDKIIVQKGENSVFNPMIMLEKQSNNLKIVISTNFFSKEPHTTESDISDIELSEDNDGYEEFIVTNIRLQKWVNINIGFIDNSIDVYLDGKLVQSFVVKGYPKINSGGLVITPGGGFNGNMSNLTYTNKSFSRNKIYNIYKKGPTTTN